MTLLRKYRVAVSIKLEGKWHKPGEIVKGDYEKWLYRGFLTRATKAASLPLLPDVAVSVSRPVSEYVEDSPIMLEEDTRFKDPEDESEDDFQ